MSVLSVEGHVSFLDGSVVIKTSTVGLQQKLESKYFVIKFDNVDDALKASIFLNHLPNEHRPRMSPVYDCDDGSFFGVEKIGISLRQSVKKNPDFFFDQFGQKKLYKNESDQKKWVRKDNGLAKIQPSCLYIRIMKSAILLSKALEKSEMCAKINADSIYLKKEEDGGDEVYFLDFEVCTKKKDFSDLINLIKFINESVVVNSSLMEKFVDELIYFAGDYEMLLDDPMLKLPDEKIDFILELGAMLENKKYEKLLKNALITSFDNFEVVCEEDYYLIWLVYANKLYGTKKFPTPSFYEQPKDPERETKSQNWNIDKAQNRESLSKGSLARESQDWNRDKAAESQDWNKDKASPRSKKFLPSKTMSQDWNKNKAGNHWSGTKESGSTCSMTNYTAKKQAYEQKTKGISHERFKSTTFAELKLPRLNEETILFVIKLLRNSYAHALKQMVTFKRALGIQRREDLQLIFEMLFPDHIRQLRPLYRQLKTRQAEDIKLKEWEPTCSTMVNPREIVEDRPPAWDELILEEGIDEGRGGEEAEERKMKMEKLMYIKQELDHSIHHGLQ